MLNGPWWSGDYSRCEFKGQFLKNCDRFASEFYKPTSVYEKSLVGQHISQIFSKNVENAHRFCLRFIGDDLLKLRCKYYPPSSVVVWRLRLSLLSFQVTTNYSPSRQYKQCLSLPPIGFIHVIWSPHEIHSSLGTEWTSYFAHTNTLARQENSFHLCGNYL